MKLMKIIFTEWRDAPIPAAKGALSESDAAQKKLSELAAREAEVRADMAHAEELLKKVKSEQLRDRVAAQVMELDNIRIASKAALAAADAAGQADLEAIKAHDRVGKFGYQVLNDEGTDVDRVVDEAGDDLPVGAVYGYQIIQTNPVAPAWAVGGKQ